MTPRRPSSMGEADTVGSFREDVLDAPVVGLISRVWVTFLILSFNLASLNTLTTGVASLTSGQLGSGNQYPLQLAAAVLMSIPVAVIFFIFQKRIMSTSEGGDKG